MFKSQPHHLESVACALSSPDLKAFLLYERGRAHLAAGGARVPGHCTGAWPPGVPVEGQFPVTGVLIAACRPFSAPGQHLQLVPCRGAESQQESTEPVPIPHSEPRQAWDASSSDSEDGRPSTSPAFPSPPALLLRGSPEPSMHSPWPF